MQRFPTTTDEFKELFPDEESSLQFLFGKRWPHGFECSYCNWLNIEQKPAKTITCSHCGHPTSVTSNTIMHGTKKPLSEWLLCIWWFAVSEKGNSAKDLQRLLKLSSYQTAWTWLQKLRMAMAFSDTRQCRDTVELATATISLGGDAKNNANIIAAAEIIMPAGITGRIKMQTISEISPEFIQDFLTIHILQGSSLILPELDAFRSVSGKNFITMNSAMVDRSQQIIKSFEIWLNKIHRGGVVAKHLQLYLDEFCFRSNAAMLPDTEAVFDLLLKGVIHNKSMSYKRLTSKTGKE
jgi:Transposase zinc-ribbon domain